jgi:hypothetical protein
MIVTSHVYETGSDAGGGSGAAGGAGEAAGAAAGAASVTGAIFGGVSALSNTVLGWLDAFCVTSRCEEAAKDRKTAEAVAEAQVQASKWNALGTAAGGKAQAQVAQTITIAALGAVGVAALWVVSRPKR